MEQRETPDYTRLPPPIRVEDTIVEIDTRHVPDPYGGRDTERDFFLRFAAPV